MGNDCSSSMCSRGDDPGMKHSPEEYQPQQDYRQEEKMPAAKDSFYGLFEGWVSGSVRFVWCLAFPIREEEAMPKLRLGTLRVWFLIFSVTLTFGHPRRSHVLATLSCLPSRLTPFCLRPHRTTESSWCSRVSFSPLLSVRGVSTQRLSVWPGGCPSFLFFLGNHRPKYVLVLSQKAENLSRANTIKVGGRRDHEIAQKRKGPGVFGYAQLKVEIHSD